jgi:hypothetical protein
MTLTERTVVRRINRKLRPDWEAAKKCPSRRRFYSTLGDYYTLEMSSSTLMSGWKNSPAISKYFSRARVSMPEMIWPTVIVSSQGPRWHKQAADLSNSSRRKGL